MVGLTLCFLKGLEFVCVLWSPVHCVRLASQSCHYFTLKIKIKRVYISHVIIG